LCGDVNTASVTSTYYATIIIIIIIIIIESTTTQSTLAEQVDTFAVTFLLLPSLCRSYKEWKTCSKLRYAGRVDTCNSLYEAGTRFHEKVVTMRPQTSHEIADIIEKVNLQTVMFSMCSLTNDDCPATNPTIRPLDLLLHWIRFCLSDQVHAQLMQVLM